ncbi:MAG TPA: AraC family transcriptional regulator [Ramlibacter sp.]|jgi:AraC-like DNA-binding protein
MPQPAADVRKVSFHNPRLAKLGIDVLELQQVRRWVRDAAGTPERLDFYLMLLVHAGAGTHRVEFVDHALARGDVLLVHPGQVQQWDLQDTLEGDLVLVSAEALAPVTAPARADMEMLALDDWPAKVSLDEETLAAALMDVGRLRADVARFEGSPLDAALIWHELVALLLRVARERPQPRVAVARSDSEIYSLLMRELEKSLDQRPSVRDLAQRTGYSESTLARACRATTGRTAKDAVDQRMALEAKRLLVHSDASVATIASKLGFSEPTNFVKFFRRLTGTSPLAFRAEQQE